MGRDCVVPGTPTRAEVQPHSGNHFHHRRGGPASVNGSTDYLNGTIGGHPHLHRSSGCQIPQHLQAVPTGKGDVIRIGQEGVWIGLEATKASPA